MKKETVRMCVICRNRKKKNELVKVVKNKTGDFSIPTIHTEGRGAYVCKNEKCIETAIKKHAFNRSFKCEVDKKIYEQLPSGVTIGSNKN